MATHQYLLGKSKAMTDHLAKSNEMICGKVKVKVTG